MRVFARKQRVIHLAAAANRAGKSPPPARAEVRPSDSKSIILQLQRTIGNRAVQRLLLQRKIDFTSGKPALSDPIPIVLGGVTILGRTRPGMNGTVFPDNLTPRGYKEAVFNALQPQAFTFKQETADEKTCKVDASAYEISVFAEVSAITKPNNSKKWSGTYPASIVSGGPSACAGKGPKDVIDVEMEGKPDGDALCTKVQTHEGEHVTDLKQLMNSELKPYHDFLLKLTGKGKTDEEAKTNLFDQVGKKDALTAVSFVDKWLAAVQVYDKPGGTHHSKFQTHLDSACTKLTIKEI